MADVSIDTFCGWEWSAIPPQEEKPREWHPDKDLQEMDLFIYWSNVDMMCGGRKTRRKARFLRKYRRLMDRMAVPCMFLNTRRLKPRRIKDYREDNKRGLKKQISWR